MAKIKYLKKWSNIDVFIGTCTNCNHDVIYGDAIDDYEFEYCPYCGVKLNEKDDKTTIKEMIYLRIGE